MFYISSQLNPTYIIMNYKGKFNPVKDQILFVSYDYVTDCLLIYLLFGCTKQTNVLRFLNSNPFLIIRLTNERDHNHVYCTINHIYFIRTFASILNWILIKIF